MKAITALVALMVPFMFGCLIFTSGDERLPNTASGAGPSAIAIADIPSNYLAAYQQAGDKFGLDWTLIAAIGKVECNHGRYPGRGCNPVGSINSAGARGPMQFLGSTWRKGSPRYAADVAGPPVPIGSESSGYASDCSGDGIADPWNVLDATCGTARLLKHNGAPGDPRKAIFAYNHAGWYVTKVMKHAEEYSTSPAIAGAVTQASGNLSTVKWADGSTVTVDSSLAPNLQALIRAAAADGIVLGGWGWRSPDRQVQLRRDNCGTSQYAIYQMPSSSCRPPTATPGRSQHERGLAIDFTYKGQTLCYPRRSAKCTGNPAFNWMKANAHLYGFRNLPSEAWHWSTSGR